MRKCISMYCRKIAVAVIIIVTIFRWQFLYAQAVTLKIIETSDVHGAIFPYDFKNDRLAATSLAQVQTYVKQQRAAKDQEVVLLDAGDILQGQPVVYYYNFEKTGVPHLVAEVMNHMGYDAAAVGNHDIEAGHSVYDRFVRTLQFPWLAANAVSTTTGKPYFKPYAIIQRNGVKIAVLGMVTPAIPNWLPEQIWQGMEFEDMVETARKWVPIIRQKEKPDLLLGLFHSGVDYTSGHETAETPKNENASRLVAEQVPGFDVVFVGHDHHGWNLFVTNSEQKRVLIVGPRNAAINVAVATVRLTYDGQEKRWQKQIAGELVDMRDFAADRAFLEKFRPEFEEVKAYVARPIGTFTRTISTRESMFGNSAFVDLIHKIQLDLTGADISFVAPLSFDATIRKGEVYVRDMFKLYKYENLLYTMELTGQEIKDYLEYSYGLWFNQMKGAADHLLNFRHDQDSGNHPYRLQAASYNFDSAAGIVYTVDVSKPAGQRVAIESMADGTPFVWNKKYKVAINSYRGNGGGGHLTIGAKIPKQELSRRIVASTEKDLRFFLMKWIEREKVVTPKAFGNWRIIPQKWWEKGKEKDFALLYRREKS